MTVRELRQLLEDMNPELEVMISYPSGNYWNQEYTSSIESVYYGAIEENGQGSYMLVNEDYLDDDQEIDYDTVIISWS